MTYDELLNKMYDFLLDYTDPNALDLLIGINGENAETYKSALYYLTGYQDFDQLNEDFYK